jgi:hypothetical protein
LLAIGESIYDLEIVYPQDSKMNLQKETGSNIKVQYESDSDDSI